MSTGLYSLKFYLMPSAQIISFHFYEDLNTNCNFTCSLVQLSCLFSCRRFKPLLYSFPFIQIFHPKNIIFDIFWADPSNPFKLAFSLFLTLPMISIYILLVSVLFFTSWEQLSLTSLMALGTIPWWPSRSCEDLPFTPHNFLVIPRLPTPFPRFSSKQFSLSLLLHNPLPNRYILMFPNLKAIFSLLMACSDLN